MNCPLNCPLNCGWSVGPLIDTDGKPILPKDCYITQHSYMTEHLRVGHGAIIGGR